MSITILSASRWLLIAGVIYLATFLREEEEGSYQNTLQGWVEKLDRRREASHSKATALMNGVARISGRVFDRLLGKRLFSFRSAAVSVCYSIASFFLAVALFSGTKYAKGVHASMEMWCWFLFFLVLGSLPAFLSRDENETFFLLLWGLTILAAIVVPVARIADGVLRLWGRASLFLFLGFALLLFAISFLVDILYIALTRWMLRRVSDSRSFWMTIGIVFLNAIFAVLVVALPIALGLLVVLKSSGHLMLGATGIGVMLSFTLNSIDLLACSIFLLLMFGVLLHRVVWPVVERPVYALARYGVLKNKKLLWTVAGVLILAPHGAPLWKLLLSKLLG